MMDTDAASMFDAPELEAATVAASVAATGAATVAATGAASRQIRPERIEVGLASDQRREHSPELRARLVAEMMRGGVPVSELSRREGICTSVLHRWHRRARLAAGLPVATAVQRLLPVRVEAPAPTLSETARLAAGLEVVLGNGRVLRVPAGADPALVAQMAAALER